MATPFYGYAEREANSHVDWSQIGSEITTMLQTETKLREDKKAAIDTATREYGEILANSPQGEYKDANEFISSYASEATAAMLVQERLLKSGQLKVKDYVVARDNIKGGTKQMFDIANEYQTKYSDGLKRWKDGESSYREFWQMRQVEGLANFTNSKVLINPTDYKLSIGKMIDGPEGVKVLSKDPDEFMTVNELRNRLQGQFDKFKLQEETVATVGTLGEVTDVIVEAARAEGGLNTVLSNSDAKKGDYYIDGDERIIGNYRTWETNRVGMWTDNPNVMSSVVTDFSIRSKDGKQIEPTYDYDKFKADETGKYYYLDTSTGSQEGIPEFKKYHYDEAEDFLRNQIRAQIDVISKASTSNRGFTPTATKIYEDDQAANIDVTKTYIENYVKMGSAGYGAKAAKAAMFNIINNEMGTATKEKDGKEYSLAGIVPLLESTEHENPKQIGVQYIWMDNTGSVIRSDNPFSDLDTYALGVLTILPEELKKTLTKEQIKKEVRSLWNKKDGGFSSHEATAAIDRGTPTENLTSIVMKDDKMVTEETDANYADYNKAVAWGIFTPNLPKAQGIASAVQAHIDAFKGEALITSPNLQNILITTDEAGPFVKIADNKNNSIGIKMYDASGIADVNKAFASTLLRMSSQNNFDSVEDLNGRIDTILETYQGVAGGDSKEAIEINGTLYKLNDSKLPAEISKVLINLAGNPKFGTGAKTTAPRPKKQ